MVSASLLGALAGSAAAFVVGDKLGRKRELQLGAALYGARGFTDWQPGSQLLRRSSKAEPRVCKQRAGICTLCCNCFEADVMGGCLAGPSSLYFSAYHPGVLSRAIFVLVASCQCVSSDEQSMQNLLAGSDVISLKSMHRATG